MYVEIKLVQKVVALAARLQRTSPSWKESRFRRRVALYASYLTVGRVLGKLLLSDRILSLLNLISYFSLDRIDVQAEPLSLECLVERTHQALQLKLLYVWRKKAKGCAGAGRLMGQTLDPFVFALDRRQSLIDERRQIKDRAMTAWRRMCLAQRVSARRQERIVRTRFERWRYLVQMQLTAVQVRAGNLKGRVLETWKVRSRDLLLERRSAPCLATFLGFSLPIKTIAKIRAFKEMRLKLPLRAFQTRVKRNAYKRWTDLYSTCEGSWRSAAMLDEIRLVAAALKHWDRLARLHSKTAAQVDSHVSSDLRCQTFDSWRLATIRRVLKRKSLSHLIGRTRFLLLACQIAVNFDFATTRLSHFRKWTRLWQGLCQKSQCQTLALAKILRARRQMHFVSWRQKADYQAERQTTTVRWRVTQQASQVLRQWLACSQTRQCSRVFYNVHLKGHFIRCWQSALDDLQTSRRTKQESLVRWRRALSRICAVRFYAVKRLASRKRCSSKEQFTPADLAEKMVEPGQVMPLILKSYSLSRWLFLHALVRERLNMLQSEKNALERLYFADRRSRLVSASFKLWRTDTLELRVVKKMGCQQLRQRQIVLELKHEEYVGSQEFITFFRTFKTWERAFQVQKMEEHLCMQNLMAYECRIKAEFLRNWKLATAKCMLLKYQRMFQRRSAYSKWLAAAHGVRLERRQRLMVRGLASWRQSLLQSRLLHRLSVILRRRTSRLLGKWCTVGKKLQEGSAKTARLTDESRVRHFLSVWRLRRHRCPVVKTGRRCNLETKPDLSNENQPRLQPNERELNKAEFMV